jgi:hypothetical protein
MSVPNCVVCFSWSCGRRGCTGGCPVLVGAVFQEVSKPQSSKKSSEHTPRCAPQRSVPVLAGE